MRDGWVMVKLGSLVHRRSDFTFVNPDQEYLVAGVQRSGWGLKRNAPARGDSMKFQKLMQLEPGNLVYRTITAFEAPSTVVPDLSDPLFVTPQTFPVYRIDQTLLDPRFMALHTTSPSFHKEMAIRCVGTVLRRKTLSKSAFEEIPVLLPPLNEQRHIVDLIGAIDDVIDAADELYSNAKSLSFEYVSLISNRPDAEMVRLGDLGSLQLGKMLSKDANKGELKPYLRNTNVQWQSLDLSDLKTMPFTEPEHVKFSLKRGDVLICEGGIVGRSAQVQKDLPGIYFQKAIHRFRSYGSLNSSFLEAYMGYAVQSGLIADFTTGTTIKHLPSVKLAELPIPVPRGLTQAEIAAAIDSLRLNADGACALSDSLRNLRSNMLAALLSGEHEIPTSYDRFLKEEVAA